MGILERKQKTFYRKTKKGNIIKIVREHYLRDDVWCGLNNCTLCHADTEESQTLRLSGCVSLSSLIPQPHLIFIDTNVALHQIDFLSHESIVNVVVPQTVVQEVRHRSLPVYKRLRDLIENRTKQFYVFTNEHHGDCYLERKEKESANDMNDRAIRITCWWYSNHIHHTETNATVVLLSDDRANREQAREMGLLAYSVHEYVSSLSNCPGLLDLVANVEEEDNDHITNKKFVFPPHWSLEKIRSMLKAGKLRQGTLKTSRHNYLEANVLVDGYDQAILVQGRENLNRSIHDDVVALELLPEDQWSAPSAIVIDQESQEENKEGTEAEAQEQQQEATLLESGKGTGERQPTARVVGVIRRKWRQYCGIIRKNEIVQSTRHTFIAADKRIPFVSIETRQAEQLYDKRIIVAIDNWPRDSYHPKGHFVRVLGNIGDKETENEVILLEHDCPHAKFSEAVLKCLPTLPWVITEKDEAEREDLRHLNICSVDPIGCTDIDDALHCRKLPNGNFEVGVHIADVSHFIRPGTALDHEAQHRSTTVYLTDRRIDMVPDLLSSNLCSLRGEVDRFAFSVIWEMTSQSEVLSSRFCKSIIRSRGELSYEQAQQRIDDVNLNDELTCSLRQLNELAKKIKEKRINDGALVLASMEVKFHIDPDTDTVVDIVAKQHLETMSMVEEFMLLANVTAAMTTVNHFPDCAMLRRHPPPPASNFKPLLLACDSQGIQLDVSSNKALADTLNNCTRDNNPFFNSMLRIMTTRCMMQALYFCSGTLEEPEYYHYGLATPLYTHFTSPIRRYADIIVHRLLAVVVDADKTYPELLDVKRSTELAQHINYRHKMAQYAGRASSGITAIAALRGKVEEYDAYILFLHKNAIQVLIPAIGQQMTLYLDYHIKERNAKKKEMEKLKKMGKRVEQEIMEEDLPVFEFNEQELCARCGDVQLRSFDPLVVQVSVDSSDVQHQRVVLKLVKPVIPGYSVPSIKTPENTGKKKKVEAIAAVQCKTKKSKKK